MWHNLYVKLFTKVLGQVGCRLTSQLSSSELLKILVRTNTLSYKARGHVCRVTHPISKIYFMARQRCTKTFIMGKICVYNWTNKIFDMGLDKILHYDREPHHTRIYNAWIEDWESDILRTPYQENDQRLLKKYKNIRLLDNNI